MRYMQQHREKRENIWGLLLSTAGVGGRREGDVKGKHIAGGEMKALSWIQITEGLICHVKEFSLAPPGIGVILKDFK